MAKTISKRWSKNYPVGSYTAVCGHCGVAWPAHQLRREATGTYACPDDYKPGSDAVSLNDANQAGARSIGRPRRPMSAPTQKKDEYFP